MKVYAVDFDGTLCKDEYPNAGSPNLPLIQFLKERQKAGDKVILNTCRTDKSLKAAIIFCRVYGLEFDAVNENLPERLANLTDSEPRKLLADYFIDDKNLNVDLSMYKK